MHYLLSFDALFEHDLERDLDGDFRIPFKTASCPLSFVALLV